MEELRGRREGSSRRALWGRHWRLCGHRFPLCRLSLIGDWFLNAIVSSINGYWVIWEIGHWKRPCAFTLILSMAVRLFAVSYVDFDVLKILMQRSLRQSHIHEQRSHRTNLALWDWIRSRAMDQIISTQLLEHESYLEKTYTQKWEDESQHFFPFRGECCDVNSVLFKD